MFKKFSSLLAIALLVFLTLLVFAQNSPLIYVNGKKIETDAFIKDGVTYIPLRAVSEALGAQVSWDQEAYAASIELNNEELIPKVIESAGKSVVAVAGNIKQGTYSNKTAHGAGVIIKSGGIILTNAHVVDGLENLTVILHDGSKYPAIVQYLDELADLAVIKIDKIGLTPMKFADESEIVAGKTVLAMGTPLSLTMRNSASMGIISGVNVSAGSYYKLIQTDAAINPGNSGGPLINLKGELVGINSLKYVSTEIEGIGFSIPVSTVKYVLSQFETYGKVKRADIGASFEESWEASIGLPTASGLFIKSVTQGGAAQKAGLKAGDIIKSVNGISVNSKADYNEALKSVNPGQNMKVEYIRDNVTFYVDVNPIYN